MKLKFQQGTVEHREGSLSALVAALQTLIGEVTLIFMAKTVMTSSMQRKMQYFHGFKLV